MTAEAQARIKINRLLEKAGWRFFDTPEGKANIILESNVKLTRKDMDAMGQDFESTHHGFLDFLLLDEKNFAFIILEAMARALFKAWFFDFVPVKAKMNGEPYPLPEEIMDLFPDGLVECELGLIPKGWRVGKLGELC